MLYEKTLCRKVISSPTGDGKNDDREAKNSKQAQETEVQGAGRLSKIINNFASSLTTCLSVKGRTPEQTPKAKPPASMGRILNLMR